MKIKLLLVFTLMLSSLQVYAQGSKCEMLEDLLKITKKHRVILEISPSEGKSFEDYEDCWVKYNYNFWGNAEAIGIKKGLEEVILPNVSKVFGSNTAKIVAKQFENYLAIKADKATNTAYFEAITIGKQNYHLVGSYDEDGLDNFYIYPVDSATPLVYISSSNHWPLNNPELNP
ncbi:MAG: hypothetical protein HQK51_01515 [Oligoflexia bacterium]|nr:hypothetical protein [Oligoflexia bacterium]